MSEEISVVVKGPIDSLKKKELDYKLEKYLKDFSPELIFYNEDEHIEFDLKGGFDVIGKADEGRRIIAGYASVAIVDDDNQYIPPEVLEDGLKSLLEDESYANVMVVHQNIQIGKILKEYQDLLTHVDDKGLFIIAEIRDNLESANGVWQKILEGAMRGFSIGGEIIDKHNHCDDDKCYEIIDKINLFEVSVCSSPVNKASGFEIIAKSDVCEKLENMCDKMTEEEIKEEVPCTDCEEKAEDIVEETVEEPVEKSEEAQETVDPLKDIIERLDSMFATMEKSILENFENIMKSMNEANPVEQEVEEKTEEEPEEEEVEETKKADEEVQYALKARDEAIEGYEEKIKQLETRIKELEQVEDDPLTTSESETPLEKDSGLIMKHGTIYRK